VLDNPLAVPGEDLLPSFDSILSALQDAGNALTAVTTAQASTMPRVASGLSGPQINSLTATVTEAIVVIQSISAAIISSNSVFDPEVLGTFVPDIEAIKTAIGPFVGPLLFYASAVHKYSASQSSSVQAMETAAKGLINLINYLDQYMGIPYSNAIRSLSTYFGPLS
jgi:hypothetical protein